MKTKSKILIYFIVSLFLTNVYAYSHPSEESPYYVVVGEVKKPGVYKDIPDSSLLACIAEAGWLTGFGDGSKVIIIRNRFSKKPEIITINFKSIMKGEKSDIKIQSGDYIIVSPRHMRF